MNKYFRTIGFLDISTRRILEKAVNKSIADYMNNQDKQPSRIVEIEIECHEQFGVMIHGECIDEEDFYVDYIIPFVRSKNYYSYINAKEENAVQMDSFFIRATFGKMNTELTFFVENSLPFYWIYSKTILVFGTLFPIEFFPAIIQPFIRYSLIYAVSYGPANLFVDFGWNKFFIVIGAQLIYLAIAFGIATLLYRKGVKKLNVNGG